MTPGAQTTGNIAVYGSAKHSVYPRSKKGHGNFIKKGTLSARCAIKKGTLSARWVIKKDTLTLQ